MRVVLTHWWNIFQLVIQKSGNGYIFHSAQMLNLKVSILEGGLKTTK
jgi:hypothetical protein